MQKYQLITSLSKEVPVKYRKLFHHNAQSLKLHPNIKSKHLVNLDSTFGAYSEYTKDILGTTALHSMTASHLSNFCSLSVEKESYQNMSTFNNIDSVLPTTYYVYTNIIVC